VVTCEGFGCTEVAPDGTTVNGCDSIYSVSQKFKETWSPYTDFMDIVDAVNYEQRNMKNEANMQPVDIVITGGEPLMQHQNIVLINTIEYFITRGHRVTMETNASVHVNFIKYPIYKKVIFTMSVKLAVSGEPYSKYKRKSF